MFYRHDRQTVRAAVFVIDSLRHALRRCAAGSFRSSEYPPFVHQHLGERTCEFVCTVEDPRLFRKVEASYGRDKRTTCNMWRENKAGGFSPAFPMIMRIFYYGL